MAKNFTHLYQAFNPKTVQDLLISPFTYGCSLSGKNGTILYHDSKKWVVIKKGLLANSYLETLDESEAVDMFWRCEANN